MTIHLLENNLREQLGHFLNCTIGLKREAQAAGANVKVYTNLRASKEVLHETEGYPIFKQLSWAGDKAADPIASMRKLGEEYYRQCITIEGIFSNDLILIGTALENQVYGIAKFVESLPPDRRPRLALNFHWENISENEKRIPAYTEAFSLLKQVMDPACVIITASTAGIVEKITSVSEGLTVKLFPCPQNYGEIRPTLKTGDYAPPTLAVLGRCLRRKGSSTIQQSVRRLRKRVPQLRYLIQATYKAPEMMLLLFAQNVRLHFGGISQDAYFEYLRSSDIFLMPYSIKAYSDRLSGIMADCAAMGGVAIVPSGTWLAKQVHAKHAAGVVYDPLRKGSIEDAVVEAVGSLERLRYLAYERSGYWWNHQSAAAYIRELNNYFGEEAKIF